MQFRKTVSILLALGLCAALSACGGEAASSAGASSASAASASSAPAASSQAASSAAKPSSMAMGDQLNAPEKGEEVAVLKTSLGTIKIRLFPEEAPKTVENFKGLIQKGYYDGLTFHRISKNFMIQGGDPTATGAGGESLWGSDFEDEFSPNLLNLRGSLAMANSGANTNGSQFFINQAPPVSSAMWAQFESNYKTLLTYDKSQWPAIAAQSYNVLNTDILTDAYKALYEKEGGNPFLDGAYNAYTPQRGHTVFGQVFEGLDVVDQIAAVEVDSGAKPKSDVVIEKATVERYEG